MFPFELIGVWLLMKGRRPGPGSDCPHMERGWGGGRLLSESANQTCSWETVGLGVRSARSEVRRGCTEGSGSRVRGRVQVPRLAWPLGSTCAHSTHGVPLCSTQDPTQSHP